MIGINAAILDDSTGGNIGIGFAVPINTVKALLPQLRKGKVIRGHIGVHVRYGVITAKDAKALGLLTAGGAIVAGVERDSPAQRAGLKAGDAIIALDNTPIGDSDDCARRVTAKAPALGSPRRSCAMPTGLCSCSSGAVATKCCCRCATSDARAQRRACRTLSTRRRRSLVKSGRFSGWSSS